MADAAEPAADDPEELRARIRRLERTIDRERRARSEAERIAENGLRELWMANRELEDRVAERTAELERTLAATTVAASAKERFLETLGHELNTPLHNVLGLLELIPPERLADEDARRIGEIRRHADELAGLLKGLVDLAGADGAPNPAALANDVPTRWLDDLVAAWTRPAARRGQLLVPSLDGPDEPIRLDWTRLRRIADELLSNAIAHAVAGPVEIAVVIRPGDVSLEVGDAGPGIDTGAEVRVLDAFVGAGPTRGVGIGLAIVDRLVTGAGGDVAIDGRGGRTTVSVRLPRP